MSDVEGRLAALEQRAQALEDELEVHRVIVRYGFAVDSGEADATAALYTEDTVFDVDGGYVMAGRQGVRDMVLGQRHQSLLPNAAHCIGPTVAKVDGDRASVTGYSRIYHREGDDIKLFRIGYNRWELLKEGGEWLIAKRTTRMIGHEEGQDVLRTGIGL